MFLDVLIGLFLIYFVFCVICSAIMELVATAFSLRAYTRKQWVARILGNKDLADEFYRSPLIWSLGNDGNFITRYLNRMAKKIFGCEVYGNPSYIPSDIFATSLVQFVKDRKIGGEIGKIIEVLESKDLSKIEEWYEEAMKRVSGWYKRKTQLGIFLIALVLAIALNLDTIEIANRIYMSSAFSNVLVNYAKGIVENPNDIPYDALKLSLGWHRWDPSLGFWENFGLYLDAMVKGLHDPIKVAGIFATALATIFGAPFWYDTLGRFVRLRATGEKPKTRSDRK